MCKLPGNTESKTQSNKTERCQNGWNTTLCHETWNWCPWIFHQECVLRCICQQLEDIADQLSAGWPKAFLCWHLALRRWQMDGWVDREEIFCYWDKNRHSKRGITLPSVYLVLCSIRSPRFTGDHRLPCRGSHADTHTPTTLQTYTHNKFQILSWQSSDLFLLAHRLIFLF